MGEYMNVKRFLSKKNLFFFCDCSMELFIFYPFFFFLLERVARGYYVLYRLLRERMNVVKLTKKLSLNICGDSVKRFISTEFEFHEPALFRFIWFQTCEYISQGCLF